MAQRIALTDGALLLEGLPGQVTRIALDDGYLTPRGFSLHLWHIPLSNHTIFDDGNTTPVIPGGHFRIPVELGGGVRLDAVIAGHWDDAASIAAGLRQSLAVTCSLTGEDDLTIGHLPFKCAQLTASYHLATDEVAIDHLLLAPPIRRAPRIMHWSLTMPTSTGRIRWNRPACGGHCVADSSIGLMRRPIWPICAAI